VTIGTIDVGRCFEDLDLVFVDIFPEPVPFDLAVLGVTCDLMVGRKRVAPWLSSKAGWLTASRKGCLEQVLPPKEEIELE
jgi:hypothetical protein